MAKLRNLLANLRRGKTESGDFLLEEQRPRYVAVIMDGNGRWAARRHLPAIAGHREGAKALKRTIQAARKLGIRELTVYAFSTENWNRPRSEVNALMELFTELIEKEVPELNENDVRVRFIGRYLYAPEMHDPELLIRTSGEQRVSNFLLWQCAYSELYFSDKLWPAFDEEDLIDALREFKRRQRRFGAR
jgi:undecaprenyl diphosphate synthase